MMNWYVVYTKPKWERKVAEQLNKLGISCYCPVVSQIRQWSDRKKKLEVPLFNSYVFVQLQERDRDSVFCLTGVVRYLFWLGKPAIVRDEEIKTIRNWLALPNPLAISVVSLQTGDTIALASGPFLDQKAIVQEVTNTHYVLVLESLGCILKMKHK